MKATNDTNEGLNDKDRANFAQGQELARRAVRTVFRSDPEFTGSIILTFHKGGISKIAKKDESFVIE